MRNSRKDPISASRAPCRRVGRDQEPPPGDRRERRSDLEFGIVAPAGALVGVGPGVIEHVLALAMALEIAGGGGDHAPARVFDDDMRRRPARAAADRARSLERVEKGVGDEWVEPFALGLLGRAARRIGARVPRRRVEGGDRRGDARGEGRRGHGGMRSGQCCAAIIAWVFARRPRRMKAGAEASVLLKGCRVAQARAARLAHSLLPARSYASTGSKPHQQTQASARSQRFPFNAARNASAVSRTPVSNGVASDQKALAKRLAST